MHCAFLTANETKTRGGPGYWKEQGPGGWMRGQTLENT